MAFHIFNVSVDSPDAQPESVPEDLSINDMESIVEIVLEKGLNIDNAIAEYDEPDENDSGSIEMSKGFKVYAHQVTLKLISPEIIFVVHNSMYNDTSNYSFVNEINPPPPKA
jgi:hypothetical protein